LLLRPRKYSNHGWPLGGEPLHPLLAGSLSSVISKPLRHRPHRCIHFSPPFHRRHRVHVRSNHSSAPPPARPLPLSCSAASALARPPPRLRSERVEVGNSRGLDHRTNQLFLASAVQR